MLLWFFVEFASVKLKPINSGPIATPDQLPAASTTALLISDPRSVSTIMSPLRRVMRRTRLCSMSCAP